MSDAPKPEVRSATVEDGHATDSSPLRSSVFAKLVAIMVAMAASLEQRHSATVVRVQDDGPGIPASEAERVFEPFFRVDRSRSKDTGGYGLGLSICKRVMQAHGGDIVLDRSRGTGACFVLTFPAT